MIAKESVRSRLDRADGGHLVHRVQLHAAAGLRLLPPPRRLRLRRCSWAARTSGATSPSRIELVKKLTGDQAYGVTTPLLTKADGTKLGKSMITDERVWLDRSMTSPYQLYQYFVNLDDDVGRAPCCGRSRSSPTTRSSSSRATIAREPRRARRAAPARHERRRVRALDRRRRRRRRRRSEALFDESVARPRPRARSRRSPPTRRRRRSAATTLVGASRSSSCCGARAMCASLGEARRAIDQGGVYSTTGA